MDEPRMLDFHVIKGDQCAYICSVKENPDGTREVFIPALSEDAPILENLDFDEDKE